MKKGILFTVLLVFLFSLIAEPVIAYADTNIDKVEKIVNKANNDINKEIIKAQRDAEKFIVMGYYDKVDVIIVKLIEKTERIAQKAIREAAKYGVKVECEYVYVEIGGKVVPIDPLRIVGV